MKGDKSIITWRRRGSHTYCFPFFFFLKIFKGLRGGEAQMMPALLLWLNLYAWNFRLSWIYVQRMKLLLLHASAAPTAWLYCLVRNCSTCHWTPQKKQKKQKGKKKPVRPLSIRRKMSIAGDPSPSCVSRNYPVGSIWVVLMKSHSYQSSDLSGYNSSSRVRYHIDRGFLDAVGVTTPNMEDGAYGFLSWNYLETTSTYMCICILLYPMNPISTSTVSSRCVNLHYHCCPTRAWPADCADRVRAWSYPGCPEEPAWGSRSCRSRSWSRPGHWRKAGRSRTVDRLRVSLFMYLIFLRSFSFCWSAPMSAHCSPQSNIRAESTYWSIW